MRREPHFNTKDAFQLMCRPRVQGKIQTSDAGLSNSEQPRVLLQTWVWVTPRLTRFWATSRLTSNGVWVTPRPTSSAGLRNSAFWLRRPLLQQTTRGSCPARDSRFCYNWPHYWVN